MPLHFSSKEFEILDLGPPINATSHNGACNFTMVQAQVKSYGIFKARLYPNGTLHSGLNPKFQTLCSKNDVA